jgi:hypothetical protein
VKQAQVPSPQRAVMSTQKSAADGQVPCSATQLPEMQVWVAAQWASVQH